MRRVKRGKREGEGCWKSGGGRTRLYIWPRVGLADEASSDAAGSEGSRGAAKPHAVIHRYITTMYKNSALYAPTLTVLLPSGRPFVAFASSTSFIFACSAAKFLSIAALVNSAPVTALYFFWGP